MNSAKLIFRVKELSLTTPTRETEFSKTPSQTGVWERGLSRPDADCDMASVEDFREWQPDEWFDKGFLQHVAASARKEVLRAVRPLSPGLHEQVHRALFAGINQPFHYIPATGWMRHLLRQESALPPTASPDQRATFMRELLAWPEGDVILLIYHQPTTYATLWGSFLKFFRQDYVNLDTMLVCHPRAREVVLFWEDHGPTLGKRGRRELPCPLWTEIRKPMSGD